MITDRYTDPRWLFRAVSASLCIVSIAFVGLLTLGLALGGNRAVITQPPSLQIAQLLPPVIVLLTLLTGLSLPVAWVRGYWSAIARVHQTIMAVLGLVFVWQLRVLGFI